MKNERKIIFSLSVTLFILLSSFTELDILYWNKNHRLSFEDFKGSPNVGDTLLAISDKANSTHKLGTISKSIDVKLVNKAGKTTFTIYAGMKQSNSWIKNKTDSVTLKHEQGHFDICEIYARILRKEIRNVKTLDEANKMYNKISDEENLEQDRYDRENTFSVGGITLEWQELILKRLKTLELFEKPIVILPIYK